MNPSSQLPTFVARATAAAGFFGLFVGYLLKFYHNGDWGYTLLWAAILGLVFAWCTRHLSIIILRAWLETRLETIEKERADKKAAKEAEEKKKKK